MNYLSRDGDSCDVMVPNFKLLQRHYLDAGLIRLF